MQRSDIIILRVAPEGKAAAQQAAFASGTTLSAWLRGLMSTAVKEHLKAVKKTLPLPRDRWCHSCGCRPDTAPTFKEDCQKCLKAQEEYRQG